jgi:murein DD-endopeptidase MepM/ murein hydrolase activator NlpD
MTERMRRAPALDRARRAVVALTVGTLLVAVGGAAHPASAVVGAMHEPITGDVISNFRRCADNEVHDGIDIQAPIGRNVFAAYRGTVRFVGTQTGYGTTIEMSHDQQTYWTLYAHLSRTVVRVGDFVERGVKIAESGQTGNAEGPHLHFEVHRGNLDNPLNMDSAYPCGKHVTAKDPIPFRFEGLPA